MAVNTLTGGGGGGVRGEEKGGEGLCPKIRVFGGWSEDKTSNDN